jgi:hypothetical protein
MFPNILETIKLLSLMCETRRFNTNYKGWEGTYRSSICFEFLTFVPRWDGNFQESSSVPHDGHTDPGLHQHGIVRVGYSQIVTSLVRHGHSLPVDLDPPVVAQVHFQISNLSVEKHENPRLSTIRPHTCYNVIYSYGRTVLR